MASHPVQEVGGRHAGLLASEFQHFISDIWNS